MIDLINIEVTQEDIDQGQPSMPGYCPLALALKRDYEYATVMTYGGSVRDRDPVNRKIVSSKHLLFPPKTSRFISNFDKGRKVKPCVLQAEVTSIHEM